MIIFPYSGDPFYGVVRFETEDTTITTVTVEAINCNGQRATKVVNYLYNIDSW